MSPTDRPSGHRPAGGKPVALGVPEEDDRLLAELSATLARVDPVPAGMADRIRFAMELDDLEFEIAEWVREDRLVGVRGSAAPDTITFTVGDLTVMVSVVPANGGNRFDGWLVPGGAHTVEVRVDGHEPTTTTADEGGRFALPDVPRGVTQIVVHLATKGAQRTRTVVTPTIML